jgi:hypothetical protein
MAAPETNCKLANNDMELFALNDEQDLQTGESSDSGGSSNDLGISKSALHRLLFILKTDFRSLH